MTSVKWIPEFVEERPELLGNWIAYASVKGGMTQDIGDSLLFETRDECQAWIDRKKASVGAFEKTPSWVAREHMFCEGPGPTHWRSL